MSKPWSGIGIGAWADEAERADEEQAAAAADVESFPSLKEAASNAKSKKKKMMMTLSEFTSGAYAAPGGRSSVGLTQQEILQLPTGPRQRSEDEMQQPGRLGGGFSSYGGRGPRDRDDSGGGRRPYGGGFDDERRGDQSRVSDFPQASRADEDDDWGKAKKLQSFDQGRHGRYSGLGGGGGSFSGGGGSYNGGGGFSRADETDNWAAVRPREDVLAEKGLDWKKLDSEIEANKGSSQTSRPSSARSNRSESSGLSNVVKPRPKVNPFGDAKPREVLLEEQGKDWRKMDMELEHRRLSEY
ncbi:hypothetical protein HID58_049147 [Brassica napus]|uniref:Uncharacterized protein n=1 Tax=Brassica napus TaxID=3708 RepID=A0ABQ8B453_BRANA|nr:hypothetical protein HID58_049147 [Brassica napus]